MSIIGPVVNHFKSLRTLWTYSGPLQKIVGIDETLPFGCLWLLCAAAAAQPKEAQPNDDCILIVYTPNCCSVS
jgi:hypothetical protein